MRLVSPLAQFQIPPKINGLPAVHCSGAQRPFSKRHCRWDALTDALDQTPVSTELTGGAGFTYEDTVVAYYLAHLLRRERAAGQPGIVTSVAVQRQGHGHPMDDVIVTLDDAGTNKSLDLQVKRSLTDQRRRQEIQGNRRGRRADAGVRRLR